MQYSLRSLFGLVAFAALFVGFAGLPGDFKNLLLAFCFLFAGVVGCFYAAGGRDFPEPYFTVFVIVWSLAVAIVMLTDSTLQIHAP
jgi:hypothetical protein